MKILVIGDNCTDIFIYGRCQRLSPEAPIPVFEPSKTITNDGMAGNVVANLRKLGIEKVELISNHEQITKTRYVEEKSNQMLLRVDSNDRVRNTFDIKKIDFDSYDAVVVADYDKGFLTLSDIEEISKRAKISFIDTKKPLNEKMKGYTFIKINEVEWELCKGENYSDWENKLIVTMSERGAMYNEVRYPVNNDIEVRDLSGAGDTFMASLVVKYLSCTDIVEAIKYANECATKVVQKKRCSYDMKLKPTKVEKSWGHELWIHNDSQYCGKLLVFENEGNRFSMHYHMIKNETWYIQKGAFEFHSIDTETATLQKDILNVGDVVYIERGKPHQLIALEPESIVFEVSTEHFDSDSYRIYKNKGSDLI